MADVKSQPEPDTPLEEELRDDTVITTALIWSLVVIGAVAAVAAIVYFTRPDAPPPEEKETKTGKAAKREQPPVVVPKLRFTDITKAAGITFVHENGAAGEKLLPETMGGGVAFFDYDGDGHPDLLLINSRRWDGDKRPAGKPATMALYHNDGKGHFTDVTAGSGLDVSFYGMGVAIGDFDNDGKPDVYITALGPNRLFRNLGNGKFEDITKTAGVAGSDDAWSTSAGFFDYDNDGRLDLFVCNYVKWTRELDRDQSATLDGKTRAYGAPQKFAGSFCTLYHNDGGGMFSDVSAKAGIQVRDRKGEPFGKSLGVCFADLDRDGWVDIVVSNDTVQNFLFRNLGNGRFEELGERASVAFDQQGNARGAMGIDIARFRNNEEFAIAIGNFSNEMSAMYVSNGRQLLFTDDAISNGVGPMTRQQLTFGVFFFDADNDGRLDLFSANGHLERDIAKVQARQSYEQPPQLMWNVGPGYATEFLPVVEPDRPLRKDGQAADDYAKRLKRWEADRDDFRKRMGDFVKPMVGRAAAFADIDGDGDLDLIIGGNGQPPRLLRNDQRLGHHWLRVKVVGTESNRDAIGAWVEVYLPNRTVLRQQVMPTRSYISQVELPLTFGLGKADRVKKVRVTWPSGRVLENTENVRVDSRMTVTEPAK
jgi:enediyne biosynthesis protein E4